MINGLFSNSNYAAAKQLLDVAMVREKALASNIANVETPGYKRVDVPADFSAQFATSLKSGDIANAPKAFAEEDKAAPSVRADGNSVTLDRELMAMTKNTVEFDALSEIVSGSLRQLRLAITGRSA